MAGWGITTQEIQLIGISSSSIVGIFNQHPGPVPVYLDPFPTPILLTNFVQDDIEGREGEGKTFEGETGEQEVDERERQEPILKN